MVKLAQVKNRFGFGLQIAVFHQHLHLLAIVNTVQDTDSRLKSLEGKRGSQTSTMHAMRRPMHDTARKCITYLKDRENRI